ncbi:MAG: ABC transporter ATP-binding protein [Bacteroidia bacterium]
MKDFLKILALLKPHKKEAFLNIFFNLFAIVFSFFSLAMLIPMLEVLFNRGGKMQEILATPTNTQFFSDGYDAVDHFYFVLAKLMTENSAEYVLMLICIVTVVSILLKNIFRYFALYFMASVRSGIIQDFRNNIYHKITVLPMSFFSEEKKGNILSKITNDVKEIEWSALRTLEALFRDPVNVILFFAMLIVMSPKLTFFVIVFMPITSITISVIAKSLRKSASQTQHKVADLVSYVEETLSGLKIIKGFNNEELFRKRFKEINSDYRQSMNKMLRKVEMASPISETLGVATIATVLWFGGKMVIDGEMESSFFLAYIALLTQIIPSFKSLTTAISDVKRASASMDRIKEIMDAEESIKDAKNASVLSSFSNKIEYKNVSFKYENQYVLRNINLTIEKGKTIALVGSSGSGKSTLADLLPRFYDIEEGEILIDGHNIKQLTLHSLRNLLGIVTQQSILFNDTVYNNIAFGIIVREEEVIRAAKIANAHEFIEKLDHGYQTNIGDGGGKLSGGQRQRLSIARAILKNPQILILDEATSALDTESEKLVQEALEKLMENRTSLVIAHRLSTILHADEIIVVDNGEIIERGAHHELLNKQGIYKKLIDLQGIK